MNKKVLLFIFIAIILVVSAVVVEQHNDHTSVGIIGGADGPTSIFVTTSYAPASIGIITLAAVILLSSLILYFRHRK